MVTGPSGPVNLEFDPRDGKGHFMAKEFGMHEVIVTNEGEAVKGAPNYIRYRRNHALFCISFWRARVCRPLLCLCRPFMIYDL